LLGGRRCYSAAAKSGPSIAGVSDIIAVASGKGGVGKSTTAGSLFFHRLFQHLINYVEIDTAPGLCRQMPIIEVQNFSLVHSNVRSM
jgi:CO dehydrogenase nickel-insertion accessory protein CooC1